MQDSVNNNFIGFDFKEDAVITHAQSIGRLELDQSLDVTMQVIAG